MDACVTGGGAAHNSGLSQLVIQRIFLRNENCPFINLRFRPRIWNRSKNMEQVSQWGIGKSLKIQISFPGLVSSLDRNFYVINVYTAFLVVEKSNEQSMICG